MRKTMKLLLVTLAAFAMAIAFAGCGSESGDFSGELTDAYQNTIVVQNGSESRAFEVSDATDYQYAEEDHLNIGDKLIVSYHTKGSKSLADRVVVEKVKKNITQLEGEITDLNPKTVTVTADSLTVTFNYDKDTKINGKLNEGDEVKVTYTGDLNEQPYATVINILEEEPDEETYEAHGLIADIDDHTFLLSVDSATSYRFTYNDKTEIDSSDDRIEVGDRAEVTFTGDIDKAPAAVKVVVHHQAKKNENVINGEIAKAGDTAVTIHTGKNVYTFLINGNTRFTGGKYKKGVKTTITYTGDLNDNPLATAIYCGKSKKQNPTKKTTKPTETKPTKKTTETTPSTDPPPPVPVIVEAQGTLTDWNGDEMTCEVEIDDDTTVDLTTENAEIACGYFPEDGDIVLIKYDQDDMDLLDMQLVDRPEPEPTPDPEPTEPTEEPTEPTEKPTEPETTKATTAEPTTTQAPDPDPDDDSSDDAGDDSDD